ncbi:MAG: hypothetical protein ABWY52_06625 [Candidatus Limnocylindrales bacterium]
MIISDEHRYVFVEQPHTACTAIRAELLELYGGRPILKKHATYAEFLRVATPAQKRYFVFSGIRNPLDERVSMFFKYRTDHKRKYSKGEQSRSLSERQRDEFAYVTAEQADFGTYLRRFYRRPYDNDTLIYHKRMDAIIRFENVQEDLSRVLERLGLEQVRPLPVVNQTSERGEYLDYYPKAIRPHAARIFGPFMQKWGYPMPDAWIGIRVPRSAIVSFRVLGVCRYIYRRYIHLGRLDVEERTSNPFIQALTAIGRPIERSLIRLLGW